MSTPYAGKQSLPLKFICDVHGIFIASSTSPFLCLPPANLAFLFSRGGTKMPRETSENKKWRTKGWKWGRNEPSLLPALCPLPTFPFFPLSRLSRFIYSAAGHTDPQRRELATGAEKFRGKLNYWTFRTADLLFSLDNI